MNEGKNYLRVTEAARRKEKELEAHGYLFNHYERFKSISDYDRFIYTDKLQKVANLIIDKQVAREKIIYNELGISNANELEQMFLGDEGLQDFIGSNFNNVYSVVAGALKDITNDNYSMDKKLNKTEKARLENSIQNAFDEEFNKLSDEYKSNLSKMLGGGAISKTMIDDFRKVSNRTNNNKMKTASQVAASTLGKWKGDLLEQCVGMFLSQLNKVKNVTVTGSNLDEFNKFIKSDVTVYTDSISIGFSAKNYKMGKTKTGEFKLSRDLQLHGGGSFESLLTRIESLKNEDLNQYIGPIATGFRSDNFYFNLVNEAVKKDTFKSSQPAIDFIDTVKALASAWFGSQLLTNTQEGVSGQNVDFLVISNKRLIPISTLLIALREQSAANIKVNISSTAKIDEEEIYQQKRSSPYTSEGLYNRQVQNIGFYAGQEVYNGIKVGAIKLSLLLQELK